MKQVKQLLGNFQQEPNISWSDFCSATATVESYRKEERLALIKERNYPFKRLLLQLEKMGRIKSTLFDGNGDLVLYDISPYLDKINQLILLAKELKEFCDLNEWRFLIYERPFDGVYTIILCKDKAAITAFNSWQHSLNPNASISQHLGF